MTQNRSITPHVTVRSLEGDLFSKRREDYSVWRPEGCEDWLLIYTLSGEGHYKIDSKSYFLRQGEMMLFEPSAAQFYQTSPRVKQWSLLWSHFTPYLHWKSFLQWNELGKGVHSTDLKTPSVRQYFVSTLKKAIRIQRENSLLSTLYAMNHLEEALLIAFESSAQNKPLALDFRVQKAVEYLTEKSHLSFHAKTLAQQSGLSISRLATLFKKQTGISPQQFWERVRIDRAAFLLRSSNLPIKEISEQVGYEDPLYFSSRFKKKMGLYPKAYRMPEKTTKRLFR